MIFHPYWISGAEVTDNNFPYLAFCECLDIVPQVISQGEPVSKIADPGDPVTGIYIVKRALWVDRSPLGDIVPLSRLRVPIELIPSFGEKANAKLTWKNSCKYTSKFFLNKYSNKEIFQSVF